MNSSEYGDLIGAYLPNINTQKSTKSRATWWMSLIPADVKDEIETAVKNQINELPGHLYSDWYTKRYLDKSWFQEASQYIEIPHREYWIKQKADK